MYFLGLALELHLTRLPGVSTPLLLVARDNCKIDIYHGSNKDEETWTNVGSMVGHENWVRCLDTKVEEDGLLVVSGGQDNYVRMWRLHRKVEKMEEEDMEELMVKEEVIMIDGQEWGVGVDSVLAGHEGWVYSVQWGGRGQLLTASMDKTMMIWEMEDTDQVWIEKVRVGEVGGNTLGYLGASWGAGGQSILGYSWGGAFHLWLEASEGQWRSGVVGGGHQQPVVDLSWEREGRYLLSVSRDQTARIHARWAGRGVWQEVGRPQVHGYDMTCCAMLPDHRYVSGAEEKVLRAFTAPSNFLENLGHIIGDKIDIKNRCQGASTPSLGLSNKAVFQGQKEEDVTEKHVKDQFPDHYFTPETHHEPPPEETLVQNTLWPEDHKLYGHGYELFCVAASPDGKLVASACKSTDVSSSAVILWDTCTWSQVGTVHGHSLTVTQLQFSPDSSKLVCVSRDRTWTLHSIDTCDDGTRVQSNMIGRSEKKGSVITRVIWSCAWTQDSKYFLTASRDKRIVVWGQVEDKWCQVGDLVTLSDSVTAVAAAPYQLDNSCYVIAAGLEDGSVQLLTWHPDQGWTRSHVHQPHHATVTRLLWRPASTVNNSLLASSSADTSVRIMRVNM